MLFVWYHQYRDKTLAHVQIWQVGIKNDSDASLRDCGTVLCTIMYQHNKRAIGDESAIEYVNHKLMVLNVHPLALHHCQNRVGRAWNKFYDAINQQTQISTKTCH